MNVYLVCKSEGEENFDWCITADTKKTALYLWKNHFFVKDNLGDNAHPDDIFLLPVIPNLEQILLGPHVLDWDRELIRETRPFS